jgi:aspartyl-tRNA(Asn)/glutamyl-tRNA(Gln) amidotransferase subunit B
MTLVKGASGDWEVVIGCEVHCQVVSKSKLFSGASTAFGAEPNSQVSLVDAAMPGMLPVINSVCVEQAVRSGLALGAQINLVSVFDRKNYFYPDLPAGYQISQFTRPIVGHGTLRVDLEDGSSREIGITRLHLEQDAGKSIHDRDPRSTHVDLNRSGVALMEIVSEPDMRSPEEAGAFVTKLRSILRYIGSCDGNMEEGSLRCDVNVSVRRPGAELGTRTETKNVNSIRFIRRVVEIEARRQIEILEGGGKIDQETRLFDADRDETRPMRSKEESHDYRYFPDPDLLPLVLEQSWVDDIANGLPELPDAKRARFLADYGLAEADTDQLVAERGNADYFEAVAEGRDARTAANWVIHDLFGQLNRGDREIADSPVSASALGGLLDLIADGTISGRTAKDVFAEMFSSGGEAAAIVEARGLGQISDAGEIEVLVDGLIADNPGQAGQFADNPKVIGWFMGRIMQATKGQANPGLVNALLRKKLGG